VDGFTSDDGEDARKKKKKKQREDFKDKTYAIVSFNTLAGSAATLVSLLEKVAPSHIVFLTTK
jgi:hypothetical protein